MPPELNSFKVGDRVRCVAPFAGWSQLVGKIGTVVAINSLWGNPIGVAFDAPFTGGHSSRGNCPDGYGRWGKPSQLELVTAVELNVKITFNDIFKEET